MRHFAAALVLVSFVLGCSKPYTPAQVDSQNAPSSRGLEQHLVESGGTLHVIWSHGMCPHDEAWAAGRIQLVARALGAQAPVLDPPTSVAGHQRAVLSVPKVDGGPGGTLVIDFIYSSDQFASYRQRLCFDSDPAGDDSGSSTDACGTTGVEPPVFQRLPMQRAKLNEILKSGIMNACLVDAVAYIGRPGQSIRERVLERLRAALSMPVAGGTAPVVIVTESLGSKIVGDAIDTLFAGGDVPGISFGEIRAWLLLSNQIPLLDVAQIDPSVKSARAIGGLSSLEAAIDRSAARRKSKADTVPTVEVVAFTDPNDVLSYRLPPGYIQLENAKVSLTNLLVSNDWTFLGLAENPGTAHPGYAKNLDVIHGIVCGVGVDNAACQQRVRRRLAAP